MCFTFFALLHIDVTTGGAGGETTRFGGDTTRAFFAAFFFAFFFVAIAQLFANHAFRREQKLSRDSSDNPARRSILRSTSMKAKSSSASRRT